MIKMIGMRKILPYLLLNFLVSALAVVIVLLIWDRVVQPSSPANRNRASAPVTDPVDSPDSGEIPPLDLATVEIQGIIGAGDLSTERVTLLNVSDLEISLAGWMIQDEDKHELLLPSITVFPGGGIVLHSQAGIDSAVEIFANQDEAVFTSGEKVRLLDSEGHLRSSYVVP